MSRESTEIYGDLYIDTSEAYIKTTDQKHKAIPLLLRLLQCTKYCSDATVWYLYADAIIGTSVDEAIRAYYKVYNLYGWGTKYHTTKANTNKSLHQQKPIRQKPTPTKI